MKNNLMCGAAVAALIVASPALAAPPPPPLPIFNWTGFYAGGNFGYSWGTVDSTLDMPGIANGFGTVGSPTTTSFPATLHPNGVIGGVQFGHNWQTPGSQVVLGFEVDFQGSAEKANTTFFTPYSDTEGFTHTRQGTIEWFDTARLRFGWLFTPTTMVYATGGFAIGKVGLTGTVADTVLNTGASFSYGGSQINFGYAVGGGFESAVANTRDWTWKVEYLYLDLGSISGSGTEPFTRAGTPYNWSAHFTDNILRVGVNYRFTHQ